MVKDFIIINLLKNNNVLYINIKKWMQDEDTDTFFEFLFQCEKCL